MTALSECIAETRQKAAAGVAAGGPGVEAAGVVAGGDGGDGEGRGKGGDGKSGKNGGDGELEISGKERRGESWEELFDGLESDAAGVAQQGWGPSL